MEAMALNLFIINNNPAIVIETKNYLEKRFGPTLNIFTFNTGVDALLALDPETNLVILDNYLEGENGTDIRKKVKSKNHKTQVIMQCPNDEMAIAIEVYRQAMAS